MYRNLLLISSSYIADRGYLEHCASALTTFYGTLEGDVLFIPYAHAYDWQGFAKECVDHLKSFGINAKSILDFENPRAAIMNETTVGVFMAGGNTFKLLKHLYDYQLLDAIQARMPQGFLYAGVSAGSVVACPGIYTTNDMPMVEPRSLKSLDLIPFQINPHFVPGVLIKEHHGETREQRIRQFHTAHKVPVLGLKEGSWLEVHDDAFVLHGDEDAMLFRVSTEPKTIQPGRLPADLT